MAGMRMQLRGCRGWYMLFVFIDFVLGIFISPPHQHQHLFSLTIAKYFGLPFASIPSPLAIGISLLYSSLDSKPRHGPAVGRCDNLYPCCFFRLRSGPWLSSSSLVAP